MTAGVPAELAERLAALTPAQLDRLRTRLRAQAPRAELRLTPGQERLWRAHHTAAGRPVDVVCQAVHLTGARVDLDLLAARVRDFVRAHEALRTTFGEHLGVVRPVVRQDLPPRLVRTRCPDGPQQAQALARELAHEPFDLAEGPLLRVALAEGASDEEAWLLVVVHNLVFDAWSFELLLDELARESAESAPAARPFNLFALEQAESTAGPQGREAARFWADELAGAPRPLPTDRPRGHASPGTGGRVDFTLPAAVARGVAEAARGSAATAYAGWAAVAWATLAEFGGDPDVLLGTFTANRDRPDAQHTVGYLLNVLPLRLRDPGDGTWAARIRAAHTASKRGLRHAAYPGELISAERRLPGLHPLLDVAFVYDSPSEGPRTVQGAAVSTWDVDKGVARYGLTLSIHPAPEGASGWIEYDTGLYDRSTVDHLAERFTALAAQASGASGHPAGHRAGHPSGPAPRHAAGSSSREAGQ
ncbi:condensation domain-containing protein [Streptomyces sp. NPDC060205]|uniref:condensation domain-containing protein n=1 Tax=Streptomyces sp. NPDC060205 TaxID=3347072 RepID=UPI0036561466